MNRRINKLLSALRQNVWFLAAFLVPLAIRSIPEILSWPYLLGLDTLTVVNFIQSGVVLSTPLAFFRNQLFYSVATATNWLIGDPIVVLKIFGPLLLGLVSVMMYLYARRGLAWSGFKSFFVALLVAIYFVTLRNSWDLYAQSFGLVFLLATLVILKSSSPSWRFPLAFIFIILTVLSHELISVILLFVLFVNCMHSLFKKSRPEFIFSVIALGLGGVLFLWRHYSPIIGTVIIPLLRDVEAASLARTMHIAGLMLYCFGLILPFVIVGFKSLNDWILRAWVILCLGFVLISMVFPDNPFYYWNRWVYLLVYPLLFFAVEGLDKLWKFGSNHKNVLKRRIPKLVAIVYVMLLLTLSGFYLVATPENQITFFADHNQYLTYIPSSMLQNTIPLRDNPSFIACCNWITDNAATDSVVVEHYALYDLSTIYLHGEKIVPVLSSPSIWNSIQNQTSLVDNLSNASELALVNGNSTVYTIWWVNGEGWYQIASLPSNFTEVFHIDRMAVYAFEP
jgi:hypothetical protein